MLGTGGGGGKRRQASPSAAAAAQQQPGEAQEACLVVAHNAVNQALLCTALGLPPAFFRRFSQSNAAFTVIDFSAAADERGRAAAPRVRVERVNQVRRGVIGACCCTLQCVCARCAASLRTEQRQAARQAAGR